MNIGALRHRVQLENPGVAVPDGDGGYTQVPAELNPPEVWASITPATTRELERTVAGTAQSAASHIIRMRYHPQVTTQTQLVFNGRRFYVTGVSNVDERNIELVLTAQEVVA